MDNYIKVINKIFSVEPNGDTYCVLECKFAFPISTFNSVDMLDSLGHMRVKKDLNFDNTFTVVGYALLRNGDVYDKNKGEKLAYLKAKQKALKKVHRTYKWLLDKYVPQYIAQLQYLHDNALYLERHISDYQLKLKKE